MSNPVNYVAAFALDENNNILFIRKNRPDWQRGYLNGVGGKINFAETAREAMSREFLEETGIAIDKHSWIYVCELINNNGNGKVSFFTIKVPTIDYKNQTDEQLELINYEVMAQFNLLPNIKVLVELSLLRLNYNGTIHCSSIFF